MKIGIIREDKFPPDKRVVFTPHTCAKTVKRFPKIEFFIQQSDIRCFSEKEYLEKGFSVVAFDNSLNMVRHAAELTGQEVLLMSFEDIEFKDNFDGIWACASVLHVPENNISTVLSKFTDALKDDGILYTSFKYGEKEQIRNGRFFADYTE